MSGRLRVEFSRVAFGKKSCVQTGSKLVELGRGISAIGKMELNGWRVKHICFLVYICFEHNSHI